MDYWKEGILHSRSPTLSNFALFLYAMVHKRKSSRLLQRSKRCCRKPNYLCYNKLFPLPIMSFINDKFIIGLALVQYLKFLCSLTSYLSIYQACTCLKRIRFDSRIDFDNLAHFSNLMKRRKRKF